MPRTFSTDEFGTGSISAGMSTRKDENQMILDNIKVSLDTASINALVSGIRNALDGVLGDALKGSGENKEPSGKSRTFWGSLLGSTFGTMMGHVFSLQKNLMDFPLIVSIMKLLKLIMFVLLLPLIPILTPLIKQLATFINWLIPKMEAMNPAEWGVLMAGAIAAALVGQDLFSRLFITGLHSNLGGGFLSALERVLGLPAGVLSIAAGGMITFTIGFLISKYLLGLDDFKSAMIGLATGLGFVIGGTAGWTVAIVGTLSVLAAVGLEKTVDAIYTSLGLRGGSTTAEHFLDVIINPIKARENMTLKEFLEGADTPADLIKEAQAGGAYRGGTIGARDEEAFAKKAIEAWKNSWAGYQEEIIKAEWWKRPIIAWKVELEMFFNWVAEAFYRGHSPALNSLPGTFSDAFTTAFTTINTTVQTATNSIVAMLGVMVINGIAIVATLLAEIAKLDTTVTTTHIINTVYTSSGGGSSTPSSDPSGYWASHGVTPMPTHAIGGFISQEGVGYLHRGERITSATEGSEKSGQTVTININVDKPTLSSTSDIKKLTQEISRELQKQFRGYTGYGYLGQ